MVCAYLFLRVLTLPFTDHGLQAAGTAFPSFLTQQFEKLEEKGGGSEEELEVLKIVAAQMQVGGAETVRAVRLFYLCQPLTLLQTWSTLLNFMANMLMNPEVQRKAQAELDTVLGGKRLPDWGDRESLPYVNALIWESARWHPSVPLSMFRLTRYHCPND